MRGPRRSAGPFRRNPPVVGLVSGYDERPDLDPVLLGRDQRGLQDVVSHGVLLNIVERTLLEKKDTPGEPVGLNRARFPRKYEFLTSSSFL